MGHSTLIGWYSPASKRFCYKDEKKTRADFFKGYTQPVYAVLEEGIRRDLEVENEELREDIKRRAAERDYLEQKVAQLEGAIEVLKQALQKGVAKE